MGTEVEHYPTLLHEPQEGVDYLHGILRLGEDTLVGLNGKPHTCILKPPHGIMLTESIEHTAHEFGASGIDLLQRTDLCECIGEVAATASCHRDLCQCLGTTLEDVDISMGQ
jgi:hypothetical protein